ncbi:MAG TPA: hypothetical protein VI685_16980, partial [Candidatus Angelobacter sp.]
MDQRHISETELNEIWFSGLAATEEENAARQGVIAHCQECSTCNDLLKSYLGVEREIESLRQVSTKDDHSHCPEEEELWPKLVADVLDEKQAVLLLKHASKCDRCAQRLSAVQKYVAEDLEEVPERESATPEWQAKTARQMALHSPPPIAGKKKERRVLFSWILWAPLTAAASVITVVLVWFLHVNDPQDVEKLLGQAYSENRTLEPRIASAQYGRMQIERGAGARSQISKPPALLRAEELVSRHLRTESKNPLWLDLKGRADLLDGNYAAALKSLQDALQEQPDSIAVLTDTATAYFELAEVGDQPQDYGNAIELLSRALAKKPGDPVALYNRALFLERMFLYHQAMDDWQHYLQIDTTGEWAKEASRHLNALRKKLDDHERRSAEPLLGPGGFLDEASHSKSDVPQELVDSRSEQYLDRATQDWLPIAFPQSTGIFRERLNSSGRHIRDRPSF